MYSQKELKSMLFIDIETVSEFNSYESFQKAKPTIEKYWSKKAEQHRAAEAHLQPLDDVEMYEKMAALSPEFGKVVVISIGQIKFDETGEFSTSKIKSFYGDDEAEILKEFMGTCQSIFNANPAVQFIGHNIKNFDFPYLIKRSIMHGITIPTQFHLQKKKPWENCLLDTYEIWKFAGWSSASLDLICDSLNIPSPKLIMAAASTTTEYWDGNLEKIKDYCEGDVEATMNVMLKISNMEIISRA
jgi:DNA polymerase elongation subunit (family B)